MLAFFTVPKLWRSSGLAGFPLGARAVVNTSLPYPVSILGRPLPPTRPRAVQCPSDISHTANVPARAQCPVRKLGFLTHSERKFHGLSLDATMLSDPKLQVAVPTGHLKVSVAALAVAYGLDLASSVWTAG